MYSAPAPVQPQRSAPVLDVLIIDDEPDGRDAVATYLSRAGHTVRCAANSRQALSALLARLPDAILLDVRMPDVDGVDVLEVVRSYQRWGAVRIAFLTAYPEDPRLLHVAALGVTRVFAKAKVNLAELRTWVEEPAAPGRA